MGRKCSLKKAQPPKNASKKVMMKIYPDRVYGFKIWLKNPARYHSTMHYGWRIWTEDEHGLGVDGTPNYVKTYVFSNFFLTFG